MLKAVSSAHTNRTQNQRTQNFKILSLISDWRHDFVPVEHPAHYRVVTLRNYDALWPIVLWTVVSTHGLSVLQNTFNNSFCVHIVLFAFCEMNEW